MSQKERVLKYMKRGRAITQRTAGLQMSIWRLSERVREIERDGHTIHRERVKRNGKTWTAYRLAA